MSDFIEYMAGLFLGIILVLAFLHFLNGTFGSWVASKFGTKDQTGGSTSNSPSPSTTTPDIIPVTNPAPTSNPSIQNA